MAVINSISLINLLFIFSINRLVWSIEYQNGEKCPSAFPKAQDYRIRLVLSKLINSVLDN